MEKWRNIRNTAKGPSHHARYKVVKWLKRYADYARKQSERQTHEPTDTLITILRFTAGNGVNIERAPDGTDVVQYINGNKLNGKFRLTIRYFAGRRHGMAWMHS